MSWQRCNDLDTAAWIWCEAAGVSNAYCGFLRRFELEAGARAAITLFADTQFKLYCNGRFVNAGPAPYRKPVVMADVYDLTPYLRPGSNEVFVLVHHIGLDTKWVLDGAAGLIASIQLEGRRLESGPDWEAYPLDCWQRETPRYCWARGFVEAVDLAAGSYAVLRRFAAEDHGAAVVEVAHLASPVVCVESGIREYRRRAVPDLRWTRFRAPTAPSMLITSGEVFNLNDTALRLGLEHMEPAWDAEVVEQVSTAGVVLERRVGEPGRALSYDLGRVCAGDVVVEIDAEAPCTVDVGFTEQFLGDRPELTRSGSRYFMRLQLRAGTNRFRLYGFHGFRWLFLVVKDHLGRLHIAPPIVCECHADLDYGDAFRCGDRALEAIYAISRRSVILNTQACSYDCNSREVGTYWGDSIFICDMVGHLSGDYRHLGHLADAATDEYRDAGVISASLYGMGAPLYDYCLVPPELLRRYHRYTGDLATVRDNLATMRSIVDDFERSCDADGLVRLDRLEQLFQSRYQTEFRGGLLFLDHPGLGWHPRETTGIDRRDVNAGIQLFLLQALLALRELGTVTGEDLDLDRRIADLRRTVRARFLDPARGLLADARPEEGSFAGCSQVVNALAVSTGVFAAEEARSVMRMVVDLRRTDIARSTPYGWFMIADAMIASGLVPDLLAVVRELYLPMLGSRATTTWETFRGEIHDSLNHAWSAVLPYALYRGALGLEATGPGYGALRLRPVLACSDVFDLSLRLPAGPLRVR
jgi:hypothetical protein